MLFKFLTNNILGVFLSLWEGESKLLPKPRPIITIGRLTFEDTKFQGFRGFLWNFKNILKIIRLYSSTAHPWKYIHKIFCFKQIFEYPRNFISLKMSCPMVLWSKIGSKLDMNNVWFILQLVPHWNFELLHATHLDGDS